MTLEGILKVVVERERESACSFKNKKWEGKKMEPEAVNVNITSRHQVDE